MHFYEEELKPVLQGSNIGVIEYMRNKGLLRRQYSCPKCNVVTKEIKSSRNKDEYIFRCYETACTGYKSFYSIRINSFFDEFTIKLKDCLSLTWKWGRDNTIEDILAEVHISYAVLNKFFKKIRDSCRKYFLINPVRLGGDGIICQIDESLFRHKPKYHRGRATDHEIWIFGIADTSITPAKFFLQIVPDRSSATLLPIISHVCCDQSIIWSDQWAGYRNLISEGFNHSTVNHSLHFVDPITRVHTQNIESYWAKVKRIIKMKKGIYGSLIESYSYEWMFKQNVYRNDFQAIFDTLKLYY